MLFRSLVNKFSHTRFEPMGHTTNPDIRIAKSVVDYIFRWMGVTFLPGFREANNGSLKAEALKAEAAKLESPKADLSKDEGPSSDSTGLSGSTTPAKPAVKPAMEPATDADASRSRIDFSVLDRAGVAMQVNENGGPLEQQGRSEQFARFQSDAPSCDNCGSITVRNGNCYLCHNCGNSMGCS